MSEAAAIIHELALRDPILPGARDDLGRLSGTNTDVCYYCHATGGYIVAHHHDCIWLRAWLWSESEKENSGTQQAEVSG